MSISSVSTATTGFKNPFAKIGEDFGSIGSALKSGSLSDAQKAYAQLTSDTASQTGGGQNPMQKDLDSLGNALESGSVDDAQKAFDKMQRHLKGAGEFALQQMSMQGALSSNSGNADEIKEAFGTLGSALSSGSVSDAQTALASLQSLGGSKTGDANDPFSKDLQSIADSLSSGNVSDARNLYSQMQEKMAQGPQMAGMQGMQGMQGMGPPPGMEPPGMRGNLETSDASDTLAQGFQQLGEALDSGNLSDAQSAFTSLAEAVQSSVSGGTSASSTETSSSALGAAIASALQKYLQSSGALAQSGTISSTA